MKSFHKLVLAILLVSLLALLLPVSLVSADEVVNFPDPNLEAAIRGAIGKPSGDILQSDLVGLTELEAGNRNIADLTGLEHCTNLEWLHLWVNQIKDLSPLSGLTGLVSLDLALNQIVDISPLSGLTSLSYLRLEGNQINDIQPLTGLTSLTSLGLQTNQISDISPLSSLINLTQLGLGNNQISDILPLSSLTGLNGLDLGLNQITDISSLASLANLDYLYLRWNQISDIKPLVDNPGLSDGDSVDVQDNPLSDTSLTVGLAQLEARGVEVLPAWTAWSYDANDDEVISRAEAVAALVDYFNLKLSKAQVVQVLMLYFGGGG